MNTNVNTTQVAYADVTPYRNTGVLGNTGVNNNDAGSGNISFRFRRKSILEWQASSVIIPEGEPCFAYDTGELKVGDGLHTWNELYNVLGVLNEIENRYLIIDDGELI